MTLTLLLGYGREAAIGPREGTIAVTSLVISVFSLLVAVLAYFSGGRQWRREGPVLAFDLTVVAYRHPGTEVVHRIRTRMEVVNVGRMAASVRAAELRGPWSDSYVLTDITSGSAGASMLQPTEYEVSNGVEFLRPIHQVREALERPPSEDQFAEEILRTMRPEPETMVRGRVRRCDGKVFGTARRTLCIYREEAWPGLTAASRELPSSPSEEHP
jgi:hypothetical protein